MTFCVHVTSNNLIHFFGVRCLPGGFNSIPHHLDRPEDAMDLSVFEDESFDVGLRQEHPGRLEMSRGGSHEQQLGLAAGGRFFGWGRGGTN